MTDRQFPQIRAGRSRVGEIFPVEALAVSREIVEFVDLGLNRQIEGRPQQRGQKP
jgi:hypothetical protein